MPKWPWTKKEAPVTEGTRAREEAERILEHHKEQRVEVDQVTANLRGLRARNQFSEQFRLLIEEGRRPK